MRIAELKGYQLVSIDEEKIVIKKGDNSYILQIEEDEGGCCGYNDIVTELFISSEELKRNPIITDIEMLVDEESDGERCKVTFFGEYKPMAELNTYSSSGSGWGYGAAVTLVCDALELSENLSSW
jgi:hypothetical protein